MMSELQILTEFLKTYNNFATSFWYSFNVQVAKIISCLCENWGTQASLGSLEAEVHLIILKADPHFAQLSMVRLFTLLYIWHFNCTHTLTLANEIQICNRKF